MTKSNFDGIAMQVDIIDELGLSDLPLEKQERLRTKMIEVVLNRIYLQTIERLSERDQYHFEQLIDKNSSQAEVDYFLRSRIKNYDALIESIILDFKEEMKKDI